MRIWPLLTALSLCSSAAAAADPTAGWQLPMTFAKLAPVQRDAIFAAAGFKRSGGKWSACDGASEVFLEDSWLDGGAVGRSARYVSVTQAKEHVFGYFVANDVSARDWQFHSSTFTIGKAFDTHGPIGPWIVTADEIVDPHRLPLRTLVNGELRQESDTSKMIFNILGSDFLSLNRRHAGARRFDRNRHAGRRRCRNATASPPGGGRHSSMRDRRDRRHRKPGLGRQPEIVRDKEFNHAGA